jgi:LDH2 family malate/lactate/ureidoglycolate dehydrogenase
MATRLAAKKLRRFCIAALKKAGLCSNDAAMAAEVLVMTDTWGTFSHGTGALRNYLKSLRAGDVNARSKPEVVAEGGNWALVDGHSGMGMLVAVWP